MWLARCLIDSDSSDGAGAARATTCVRRERRRARREWRRRVRQCDRQRALRHDRRSACGVAEEDRRAGRGAQRLASTTRCPPR